MDTELPHEEESAVFRLLNKILDVFIVTQYYTILKLLPKLQVTIGCYTEIACCWCRVHAGVRCGVRHEEVCRGAGDGSPL